MEQHSGKNGKSTIAIVGGGLAGLTAAIACSESGPQGAPA